MSAFLSADWTPIGRQVANHLWQSTLFAAVAGMLVLLLRNNHARMRHWLWMAASVKFLVPFSLIVAIGGYLGQSLAPRAATPLIPAVAEQIAQPFTSPDNAVVAPSAPVPPKIQSAASHIIVAVWFCGFAGILVNWHRKWRRVAKIVGASAPPCGGRPVEVLRRLQLGGSPRLTLVSSAAKLEPGIFGVVRPVLWVPRGIGEYLSDAQLEAILAHELCHARRCDNLLAAIHMAVEAVFWFHPLVWWLGARLEEERERACDEEVVRLVGDPQAYAEGVLKVCEFYLASPVACAAGVTGGELKKRIEGIMTNRFTRRLSAAKKILLASAAVMAIGGPVSVGLISPPAKIYAQAVEPRPAFEVASVKPTKLAEGVIVNRIRTYSGPPPIRATGNRFTERLATVESLVMEAYGMDADRVFGLPDWAKGDGSFTAYYEVDAKVEGNATPSEKELRLMVQSLLADRFQLKVHREAKEIAVYALLTGEQAPKLREITEEEFLNQKRSTGQPSTAMVKNKIAILLMQLSPYFELPVVDRTGLGGPAYEYSDLNWVEFRAERQEDPLGVQSRVSAAIREKLGLRVERRKEPVDVIVVDHVEKPSPN